MDIVFRTRKLERVFNSKRELVKEYGNERDRKIQVRMAVLRAATSLADVPTAPPDRCHELKGERTGDFAVDLVHPFRLVFRPQGIQLKKGEAIRTEIVSVIMITGVEDYH